MLGHTPGRSFGLDLLRATSIVVVVLHHADDLLDAVIPSNPGLSAVDGVDLSFILSGYLIGRILLRYAEADHLPWHRRLLDFMQRRWLRTLPNYYLFLLINIALVFFGLAPGVLHVNTLAYFGFMQNLVVHLGLFFHESWSLAVEEWFYLLFPLATVLFTAVGPWRARSVFPWIILAFLVVPAVLRLVVMPHISSVHVMNLQVRTLVPLRLDTLGFGVLAAWCAHRWPVAWARHRWPAFVLGLVGYVLVAGYRPIGGVAYQGTWYFTCSAASLALALPLLSAWRAIGPWTVPITFLGSISYALYLVHLPVRHLFLPLVSGCSPGTVVGMYVLYWGVCVLLAAAVHRYYERPFMAYRDRLSQRLVG
jgi:peptidoglycan/LPS O-acetylase OafA/YrhL